MVNINIVEGEELDPLNSRLRQIEDRMQQLESTTKLSTTPVNNSKSRFYLWLASLVDSTPLSNLQNPCHAAVISMCVLLGNAVFIAGWSYYEVRRCDLFNTLADGDWGPKEYQELYGKSNTQICGSEYMIEALIDNNDDDHEDDNDCHNWIPCTLQGFNSTLDYGGFACDLLIGKVEDDDYDDDYDDEEDYGDDGDNDEDDRDNGDDDEDDGDDGDDDEDNGDDGNDNEDSDNGGDYDNDDGIFADWNGCDSYECSDKYFESMLFEDSKCEDGSPERLCKGIVSIVHYVCPKLTPVIGATIGYVFFIESITLTIILFGYNLRNGNNLTKSFKAMIQMSSANNNIDNLRKENSLKPSFEASMKVPSDNHNIEG